MKVINLTQMKASEAFARKAAEHFKSHPTHYTYSEGDPKAGELFAVRWNDFTVLVVKLDEAYEPECWPCVQFVGGDLPKLKATP